MTRVEVRMKVPVGVSIYICGLQSIKKGPALQRERHVPNSNLLCAYMGYVLARTYSKAANTSSSLNLTGSPPRVEERRSSCSPQIMVVELVAVARQRVPGNPLNDEETEWPPEF